MYYFLYVLFRQFLHLVSTPHCCLFSLCVDFASHTYLFLSFSQAAAWTWTRARCSFTATATTWAWHRPMSVSARTKPTSRRSGALRMVEQLKDNNIDRSGIHARMRNDSISTGCILHLLCSYALLQLGPWRELRRQLWRRAFLLPCRRLQPAAGSARLTPYCRVPCRCPGPHRRLVASLRGDTGAQNDDE